MLAELPWPKPTSIAAVRSKKSIRPMLSPAMRRRTAACRIQCCAAFVSCRPRKTPEIFEFERATQQTGEAASASFLVPHRREERTQDAVRDSPTTASADLDPRAGHEAFLADIVAVAERFGFEPEASPGRDEPRLRGLRQ